MQIRKNEKLCKLFSFSLRTCVYIRYIYQAEVYVYYLCHTYEVYCFVREV